MSGFSSLDALIPHAGPMRLLERVVAHDDVETRCEVKPARSALFADPKGRVPAWVGLEYMAQCAAVHGGLRLRESGAPLRPALFLGSRRLVFRCDGFDPDGTLDVVARHSAGGRGRLAFEAAVLDPGGGPPLVEGRLTVLVPEDLEAAGTGIL
jgi:predicted hotdog family 3-hydroxylacyl-ACP dehydratase